MTRCYVSEQIAAHCNQDEELLECCFHCDEAIEEDDESHEVLIQGAGWCHVHDECNDRNRGEY